MKGRKNIKTKITNLLWGRSAGRCEFEGCNKLLSVDGSLTQDKDNFAQVAHIVGTRPGAARWNNHADELFDDIGNLMLLCPYHHKLIDGENRDKYTVDILKKMKKGHEDRIKTSTSISPNKQSTILIYTPSIGSSNVIVDYNEAAGTLFPDYYPSSSSPIELSTQNAVIRDSEPSYWQYEKENLRQQFIKKVESLDESERGNISVFALAPQPLLVYLGTLLGDMNHVTCYQKHREPDTWRWLNDNDDDNDFRLEEPEDKSKKPVLVFAISSQYIINRIRDRYKDASIWIITCSHPHNDMLRSKEQLSNFGKIVKDTIEKINCASDNNEIRIHMAMPAALALELGRVRMPKADKSWVLYDYNKDTGDIETFTI